MGREPIQADLSTDERVRRCRSGEALAALAAAAGQGVQFAEQGDLGLVVEMVGRPRPRRS